MPYLSGMATCKYCNNLQTKGVFYFPGTTELSTRVEGLKRRVLYFLIKRSFEAGCQFCGYLLEAAKLRGVDASNVTDFYSIIFQGHPDGPVVVGHVNDLKPRVLLYKESQDGDDEPQHRAIAPTPGSPADFAFLRSRLEDCLENHKPCDRGQIIDRPLRLLAMDDLSKRVRLVDGADSTQPYVTLCHCWGKSQPLKLTKASYGSFRFSGVNYDDLPATFRDAVTVAQEFGVGFIWIDSMCIVQDDPSDWAKESSKMAAIFENALFTIVTASSSDNSISFLERKQQTGVLLGNGQSSQNHWRARKEFMHGIHSSTRLSSAEGAQDPVDKRAWTLQEQLLSTRKMIFSTEEVQWGCLCTEACECSEESPSNGNLPTHESGDMAFKRWQLLVQNYSHRSLTFQYDLLPALSGLASRLSNTFRLEYLAGMWKENLLSDMLWRVVRRTHVSSQYLAPSYSWASIGRHLELPATYASNYLFKADESFRVGSVECTLSTENRFGSVSHGYMAITATPEHFYLARSGEDYTFWRIVDWTEFNQRIERTLPNAIFYPDCCLARAPNPNFSGDPLKKKYGVFQPPFHVRRCEGCDGKRDMKWNHTSVIRLKVGKLEALDPSRDRDLSIYLILGSTALPHQISDCVQKLLPESHESWTGVSFQTPFMRLGIALAPDVAFIGFHYRKLEILRFDTEVEQQEKYHSEIYNSILNQPSFPSTLLLL